MHGRYSDSKFQNADGSLKKVWLSWTSLGKAMTSPVNQTSDSTGSQCQHCLLSNLRSIFWAWKEVFWNLLEETALSTILWRSWGQVPMTIISFSRKKLNPVWGINHFWRFAWSMLTLVPLASSIWQSDLLMFCVDIDTLGHQPFKHTACSNAMYLPCRMICKTVRR